MPGLLLDTEHGKHDEIYLFLLKNSNSLSIWDHINTMVVTISIDYLSCFLTGTMYDEKMGTFFLPPLPSSPMNGASVGS